MSKSASKKDVLNKDIINFAKALNLVIVEQGLLLLLINVSDPIKIVKINTIESVRRLDKTILERLRPHLIDKINELVEITRNHRQAFSEPFATQGMLIGGRMIDYMKQYENVIPNFSFLGTVWSNCSELSYCPLYQYDFDKALAQGKKQLGVIFNTDIVPIGSLKIPEGKHWIALYINIPKNLACFCDSGGTGPCEKVGAFLNDFKSFCRRKYGKTATVKVSNKRIQEECDETCCGVYGCNFLLRMVAGQPFEFVIDNSLNYENILSCRRLYFTGTLPEIVDDVPINPACNPLVLDV